MTKEAAKTVLLMGSTGTIGQAVRIELEKAGWSVIAPVRSATGRETFTQTYLTDVMRQNACDTVISCLASRNGAPDDAWAVDHDLNQIVLNAALNAGVRHFVLLSAICVQKPQLAFQHAKLAFEAELQAAPITTTIVRPTAYFKSLSGQVNRLRAGKPFLLFGDGALTACKPISDRDLARFMVRCLTDREMQGRILPIGGPGPAITPREQGEMLFDALGKTRHFSKVPIGVMNGIIFALSLLGRLFPAMKEKAELARIGRYYATQSMLVWDPIAGQYDADQTPEFGTDTLAEHYARLAQDDVADERGAHAVF